MSIVTERLKAAAQAAKERNIRPEQIDMRGSGLTKKELAKSENEYKRQEKTALKSQDLLAAKTARDQFEKALDETALAIEEACRVKNIVLDGSQMKALRGILENRVSCLIGAAGTGKTTVTRILIEQLIKKVRTIDLRDAQFVSVENPDGSKSRVRRSSFEESEYNAEKAPAIAGAAFTGRASQQFKKALPEEYQRMISTIHSLLGYAPTEEVIQDWDPIARAWYDRTRRVFKPSFDEANLLPYTVYILDEASMIPIPLFNELIASMPKNSRIVLIGDIHQLPPVMGKSVLGYALQKWPTFELTQIHRQAEGNAIIANAHRILKGQMVQAASNFHLIETDKGGSAEMQTYVRQVMAKLWEMKRYDPYRDALIVPQNKGMIGQVDLNEYFMTLFNPEKSVDGIIINKRVKIHTGTGHTELALGDKMMILSNINTVTPPITNGMIGIIETINLNGKYDQKRSQIEEDGPDLGTLDLEALERADSIFDLAAQEDDEKLAGKKDDESADQRQSSHVVTMRFEGGQTYTLSTAGDFRRVTFGYAFTCHKAQGGEYPNVFIVVHSSNAKMLCQEWLYTAVTRARLNVYLIFNKRGLRQAIERQRIKGRTLQEKIHSYVVEAKSDDIDLSVDPYHVDRAKFPVLFNPEKV